MKPKISYFRFAKQIELGLVILTVWPSVKCGIKFLAFLPLNWGFLHHTSGHLSCVSELAPSFELRSWQNE